MTDNNERKIEFNSISTKMNNIKINSIKNTDNNKEIAKINPPNEYKKKFILNIFQLYLEQKIMEKEK